MMSSFIPIFFRWLNFGIIIGLGVYLYRTYGHQMLLDMFESNEAATRALYDEVAALEKRAQEQQKAFAEQQALGVLLSRNIEEWKKSVAQKILVRQQEKESLTRALQQKSEHVAEYTTWIATRRECLSAVNKEVVESLTTFYADRVHAQEYLATVVSRIKDSSSQDSSSQDSSSTKSKEQA